MRYAISCLRSQLLTFFVPPYSPRSPPGTVTGWSVVFAVICSSVPTGSVNESCVALMGTVVMDVVVPPLGFSSIRERMSQNPPAVSSRAITTTAAIAPMITPAWLLCGT